MRRSSTNVYSPERGSMNSWATLISLGSGMEWGVPEGPIGATRTVIWQWGHSKVVMPMTLAICHEPVNCHTGNQHASWSQPHQNMTHVDPVLCLHDEYDRCLQHGNTLQSMTHDRCSYVPPPVRAHKGLNAKVSAIRHGQVAP
jgi:hypothetical protein